MKLFIQKNSTVHLVPYLTLSSLSNTVKFTTLKKEIILLGFKGGIIRTFTSILFIKSEQPCVALHNHSVILNFILWNLCLI